MIVGIAGAAGSGKDTVADILCSKYGFLKGSMGLPLRLECADFLKNKRAIPNAPPNIRKILKMGLKVDVWAKPTSPEARRLMQYFGTEFRRAQDSAYWVKRTEPVLNHVMDFVISDIRYENEAEMVRRHGGKLWKVERGVSSLLPEMSSHISEQFHTQYADWDALIDNNSDLNGLENKVSDLMMSCYSIRTDDSSANSRTSFH